MREIDNLEFIGRVERGVPVERLEMRMKTPFLGYRTTELQVQAHDGWENFATEPFLGENESLLGVIRTDWQVVERYRTTHAAIANALRELIAGRHRLPPEYEFVDRERQREVFINFIRGVVGVWGGMQECPWFCDTFSGDEGTIVKKGLTEDERIEAYVAQFKFIDSISSDDIDDLLHGGKGAIQTAKLIQRIQANRVKRKKPIYAFVTGLLPHLIEEHYFFEGKESPYRADPAFLIAALGFDF